MIRCERCHNLLSRSGRLCDRCVEHLGGKHSPADAAYIPILMAERAARADEERLMRTIDREVDSAIDGIVIVAGETFILERG